MVWQGAFVSIFASIFVFLLGIINTDLDILDIFSIILIGVYFVGFMFASAYKDERDSKRQFLRQTKLKKEFKKSK